MRRPWTRWDADRIETLRDLAGQKLGRAIIAEMMNTSPGAVSVVAGKHGISLATARKQRVPSQPDRDPTRQRRFIGIGESDGPRVTLQPWHPALRNGATIFGQMVVPAARAERLLKSGEHNRKIGSVAAKGRWSGMPILTLTLEERATCPSTCLEWATCYGNNMGRAPRVSPDDTLDIRLYSELIYHAANNPQGFIVRLHVLGDFYSTDYVKFWRDRLQEFPQLHIFGFTARPPADPIGRAVLLMMEEFQDQCLIRVSAGGKPELCSEVVDDEADAIGILCPAEKDAERCCATCGLCWTTSRTITFLRH